MPKSVSITCDQCGRDVARGDGYPRFRLEVRSERVPSPGGVTLAVPAYPEIEADAIFCGLGCLSEWVEAKRPAGGTFPDPWR